MHYAADGINDRSGRTDCVQVVPLDQLPEDAEAVTCPMCLVVMRARASGEKASRALRIGKDSGIFRPSSVPPKKREGG